MSRRTGRRAKSRRSSAQAPRRRELRLEELDGILERAGSAPLSSEDVEKLRGAVQTLAFITQELEHAGTSIARLRKLLFGSGSEKTREVLGEREGEGVGHSTSAADVKAEAQALARVLAGATKGKGARPRKGHGRTGAESYAGAHQVTVAHDALTHRDPCPSCDQGRVYRQRQPSALVRVRGMAPLSATVYELERLRCSLCGEVFTAPPPPGVGEKKYDETAPAMIALLKYGCGLPFNRIEQLGKNLRIPLPAATQWELVAQAAGAFEPVWAVLIEQAAGAELLHIDDTNARVLSLAETIRTELALGVSERTGVFTSGVVASVGERRLALFFTGREHAGENLAKVLAQRASDLPAPIRMCDAASRNTSPGEFDTILAHCIAHARRHFVDVVHSFPEEVAHVLHTLREVYRNDAHARAEAMSPEERLEHHQAHSQVLMDELGQWLQAQFDERRVEPNSTLGGAIRYMQTHWEALTLFLRVPAAPLDNNICERALKRAIMHRKNSLFYKTENGAHVGDVFLSLIHTAELCGANPFDYLVAVQRHREAVAQHPEQWMPWNYIEAQAQGPPTRPEPQD